MAVAQRGIGAGAFMAFHKEVIHFQFAARAADAAEGGGDDVLRLDEPGSEERDEGQQNARGITARRGDEGGVLDLRPVDFGQTIDRLFEQLRRGMDVPVEFLVSGGVFEPEIGA